MPDAVFSRPMAIGVKLNPEQVNCTKCFDVEQSGTGQL